MIPLTFKLEVLEQDYLERLKLMSNSWSVYSATHAIIEDLYRYHLWSSLNKSWIELLFRGHCTQTKLFITFYGIIQGSSNYDPMNKSGWPVVFMFYLASTFVLICFVYGCSCFSTAALSTNWTVWTTTSNHLARQQVFILCCLQKKFFDPWHWEFLGCLIN